MIRVDKAMTKMNDVYQINDFIPLKRSLEADQKKFKRDEVLLRS